MVNPAAGPTGGGRRRRTILRIVGGTALAAAALASLAGECRRDIRPRSPAPSDSPAAAYSAAVTQVCAGALLFDHAHQMGTRPDALSIADDIRASTARRLDHVTAVSVPPELQNTQQPLDRLTTPTRGALRHDLGPHLRHHRRRSHTSTTSHSPKTAREAHPYTRRAEIDSSAPRTRTERPRLHRRRRVSRPVCRQALLGPRETAREGRFSFRRTKRAKGLEPSTLGLESFVRPHGSGGDSSER